MKRLYVIFLINCLFLSHLYSIENIESDMLKGQIQSPVGIYFKNKTNISAHAGEVSTSFAFGNFNYTYNAADFQSKNYGGLGASSGTSGWSANSFSGRGTSSSYAGGAVSGAVNMASFNKEKAAIPAFSSEVPIFPTDIPVADNPSTEGPGGSSSGNVVGHVGAPVGDGVFILLILVSFFFYIKVKRVH